jgi:hypothetical protein
MRTSSVIGTLSASAGFDPDGTRATPPTAETVQTTDVVITTGSVRFGQLWGVEVTPGWGTATYSL